LSSERRGSSGKNLVSLREALRVNPGDDAVIRS